VCDIDRKTEQETPPLSSSAPDTARSDHAPAPRAPENTIRPGDMVILFTEDGRRIPARAGEGKKGTHFGEVSMASVVGLPYGHAVHTNLERPVYVLPMTLQDHILSLKRRTQIIYPKDIGTILVKLGVGHGSRVLECGTGSGSLTTALAWAVGPSGMVYSYEREAAFSERAAYNLRRAGMMERVVLKVRDLEVEGVDERNVDAGFLDVREPPRVLDRMTEALAPGAVLGVLVPTTNQVSQLLDAFTQAPYVDIEVLETFVRQYKVNAQRLRPEDRMIGHTGYLVFARRIVPAEDFKPVPRRRANQVAKALARLRREQAQRRQDMERTDDHDIAGS